MNDSFLRCLLISAILPAGACAHDPHPDRLTLTTASHHVAAAEGETFNPINPGVLVTWEGDPLDITAGAYLNSYRKPSVAALASIGLMEGEPFAIDAFAGAAYYPEDGRRFAMHLGDIVPIAGLQARIGNAAITVMPSDCIYTCAIVMAGFSFDL